MPFGTSQLCCAVGALAMTHADDDDDVICIIILSVAGGKLVSLHSWKQVQPSRFGKIGKKGAQLPVPRRGVAFFGRTDAVRD